MITEATSIDIEGIIKTQRETWIATYAGKGDITTSDIESINFEANAPAMKQEIAENGVKKYWVAKDDDNQVIGYGYAIRDPARHEIKSLYVRPDSHGKGVGSMLMDKMMQFLGDEQDIYLDVLEVNRDVLRFYGRYGFVEIGRRVSTRFLQSSNKSVEVIQTVRKAS